jgi:hypothetical protein
MKGDIISMTMTELFLMLLFLTIVITQLFQPETQNPGQLKQKLDVITDQLKKSEQKRLVYEIQLAELRKNKVNINLKSKQKPSCIEIGISDGFLGSIVIEKPGYYRILKEDFTLSGIKTRFRHELEKADKFACVHSLKVTHHSGISLKDYLDSLKKLERIFYIKRV